MIFLCSVLFVLVVYFGMLQVKYSIDVSPAEAALRQAWETRLEGACEPTIDTNGVRWCTALVRLKGAYPRVVQITAIYLDGRLRVISERSIMVGLEEIDPDDFGELQAINGELALAFRKVTPSE